jgi:hypothetical protein
MKSLVARSPRTPTVRVCVKSQLRPLLIVAAQLQVSGIHQDKESRDHRHENPGADFAFCGARLQACRVDSRVDVLLRRNGFVLRSNAKSMRYPVFSTERSMPEFSHTLVREGIVWQRFPCDSPLVMRAPL